MTKIVREMQKCCVCGRESEQYEIMSMSMFGGSQDLDGKPSNYSTTIMECPYCHYCNYAINDPVERRFVNRLELWNSDSSITRYFNEENDQYRKIMILLQQHKNNMDYEDVYRLSVNASWVCDPQKASMHRKEAILTFLMHILPKYRDTLFQVTDMLRMEKDFEGSKELLDAISKLFLVDYEKEFGQTGIPKELQRQYEEEKYLKELIKLEENYINNKDYNRHSTKNNN